MKKLMVALLLLVATSSLVFAQAQPSIGLYGDNPGVICQLDIPPFVNTPVYFFAVLPPEIPGITAVEFSVSNVPDELTAVLGFNWNTTLVIGELGYGIALAFNPPLDGPNAYLGYVNVLALVDLGMDYRMEVLPSNDSGNLVVVDLDFNEVDAEPGHIFTINCTGGLPGGCDCILGVATEEANWGQIKALY
jgi:opacity protein-like surface antigen